MFLGFQRKTIFALKNKKFSNCLVINFISGNLVIFCYLVIFLFLVIELLFLEIS